MGSRIGRLLLSYILAFSFLVTLATTAFILFSDYKRGVSSYDQSITQIRSSYLDSISYSLWNFDIPQLESQLIGILNFPGVAYVFIESSDGTIFSAGDVMQGADTRHDIELTYRSSGREYSLGTLFIDLDYADLYSELQSKAINILLTQFVKTFSVSIFILFIINRLLTRRLQRMSHWADQFSLKHLDQALEIPAAHTKADELDDVVNAINHMRQTLQQDVVREQQATLELETTKERLAIAIDNAALGFCEYHLEQDKFDANSHFASQLGLTSPELEQLKHPMDVLLNALTGSEATEQRERLHQLLYGRIPRVSDTYQLLNQRQQLCYFDITFQITGYQDNRPTSILICMVDKTHETISSQQAQELNINLENRVAKRTEELYDEQMRAKLALQRVTQQLERCQAALHNQRHSDLSRLLLEELDAHFDPQQQAQLDIFQQYLRISISDDTSTMDLAFHLAQWMEQLSTLSAEQKTVQLPLSLVLEENPRIFQFMMDLLIPTEAMAVTQNLRVTMSTDGLQGKITVLQSLTEPYFDQRRYALASFIAENRLQGGLSKNWHGNDLSIELTFGLAQISY
ncbi:HAMP domain-containing protein [Bacterioplanes sanyensis]|uniref:HAMP domain-containing protein n=1 Tax=Bacterioplanes sanyensis TaxID=1249553 RepID=UPI0018EE7061|nr:HAMP domain-containing protein [Bacterioplanes sanyensis]